MPIPRLGICKSSSLKPRLRSSLLEQLYSPYSYPRGIRESRELSLCEESCPGSPISDRCPMGMRSPIKLVASFPPLSISQDMVVGSHPSETSLRTVDSVPCPLLRWGQAQTAWLSLGPKRGGAQGGENEGGGRTNRERSRSRGAFASSVRWPP